MDKEECLTYLQESIKYFNNVTIKDFQLLSVLDSESLSIMDIDVYQVTPLLKQICDYSLISCVLEECELEKLEKSINKNNKLNLEEILELSEICCDYIVALLGEDCTHPSILKKLNLTNGFNYITTFNDNVMNLLNDIDDNNMYDSILDFGNYIEEKFDNIMEDVFNSILKKIRSYEIKSNNELLVYLMDYIKNLLNLSVINTKFSTKQEEPVNIIINNQCHIHILDNSSAFPGLDIKTYDLINGFILIIKKLEEYKRNKNISKELLNKINELIELYNAYYLCKYECIKNTIDEQIILEKCKKM